MGAHLTERDGVSGVMFCLWAPSALTVSLIGDLNSWDGRHHPMQQRVGGIWELFIPGLEEALQVRNPYPRRPLLPKG